MRVACSPNVKGQDLHYSSNMVSSEGIHGGEFPFINATDAVVAQPKDYSGSSSTQIPGNVEILGA